MFKSIIASAALLSAFAISANAADMVESTDYAPAPVEQATQPLFTWSGGYVGIQGGGTWASGDITAGGVTADDDFDGGLVGGFAGWNAQSGDIVYGIEGDLNYNWNGNDYTVGGTTAEVGTDVSGAVRGRVGYAMNNALLYAAGGWTAARGYVDVDGGPSDSETFNGWTVGAGVDYAFTNNMFGRLEYRYNNYGDETIGTTNVDFDQHQVTVGLGVKF
jgi:outer membrane immunogenic protein